MRHRVRRFVVRQRHERVRFLRPRLDGADEGENFENPVAHLPVEANFAAIPFEAPLVVDRYHQVGRRQDDCQRLNAR